MSPSITETLFALGVGNRVVGVTDFCSYPKEACALPKIGGLLNPSVEAWITLKPDLIIHQDDSHKLRINAQNLGIRTLAISMTRLQNIFETIKPLARCWDANLPPARLFKNCNPESKSQKRASRDSQKNTLLLLSEGGDPNGALYAVVEVPFSENYWNWREGKIFSPIPHQLPKISKEFILRHSPEVIIQAGPHANLTPQEKAKSSNNGNGSPR